MENRPQKEVLISVVHTLAAYTGAGSARNDEWWREARELLLPTLEAMRLHAECNWPQFQEIWQDQLIRAAKKRV